jgi:branched-subunit amino acid transport protein
VSVTTSKPDTPDTPEGTKADTTPTIAPTSTATVTTTPTTVAEPVTDDSPQSWSLFNLLATILAGLLLIFCLVKFFFGRRRDDDEYEEEPIDPVQWAAMAPDQRVALMVSRENDRLNFRKKLAKENQKGKHYYINLLVLLIVAAGFVESLVMLLLTQDFSLPMVFCDKYSWIFALIFFAALIVPAIAAVLHKSNDSNSATPEDRTGTGTGTGTSINTVRP